MEIGNRILLKYEDLFSIPPRDVREYLKMIPREICIRYGLLISNYTKNDDIYAQIANLDFKKVIQKNILDKHTKLCLPGDYYILFSPQTGLELLRYVFSIPESEFRVKNVQYFPLPPLLLAILKINSELLSQGSHFQDRSFTLFAKQIRSRNYETDERIMVFPVIYRMFCLLHFLEQNNGAKWVELKKRLLANLGTKSLQEYFSTMLHILEKCNLEPKISNTIFRNISGFNFSQLFNIFSFEADSIIELEQNRDYTYFKNYPIVKLNSTEFAVISNVFLADQLYISLKFRMSNLCRSNNLMKFFSVFNNDFVEKYLLNHILSYTFHDKNIIYLTEDNCKDILDEISHCNKQQINKDDKKRLPDGYIRIGNKILLIECKAKILSTDAIENENKCLDDINGDIVNEKKGTGQLMHNCKRILDGKFYADGEIPSGIQIYPLLVVDDRKLSAEGINRYIIENTTDSINNNSKLIRPFTVLDMDTLILISELIRDGSFDIFNEIESYHIYISGKDNNYSIKEYTYYSDASFPTYIYEKYETKSPAIIDEWLESKKM